MSRTASPTAVTFKNILVATDLSPASLWSLPHVVAIAHPYGSALYLANVSPLDLYGAARPESFDAIDIECHDHAQEKLERYSARVRAQDIPVQCLLDGGDVGLVIADWIKKYEIDLLAVGTTGRSGLRKLFLGSTAEELIRAAPCPVLTVGPGFSSETPTAVRTILYATDFSADSLRAAAYAFSMARHHDARLVLLHVIEEHDKRNAKRSFIKRLQDLGSDGLDPAIESEVLVAEGRPAKKILEVASQHSADLIAIGVRGAGGFARASSHFGSTAHDVIVAATCPVLTTRASRPQ